MVSDPRPWWASLGSARRSEQFGQPTDRDALPPSAMGGFYARCRSDACTRRADHAGSGTEGFRDFNSVSKRPTEPLDHRRRRGTSLRFAPASRRSLPARSRDALPLGARDRVAAPFDGRPAMVARQVLSRTAPAMGGRHAVPFRYFLHRIGHPCHVVGASRRRAGWSGAVEQPVGARCSVGSSGVSATRPSRWPSASRTCSAE